MRRKIALKLPNKEYAMKNPTNLQKVLTKTEIFGELWMAMNDKVWKCSIVMRETETKFVK